MSLIRTTLFFGLLCLGGCGFVQPGRPGDEPPSGGRYNPVSHENNESSR